MARIGNNPNRNTDAQHKFSRVVLTAITHLPNTEGYHAKRLNIVKKCLTSMRYNAGGVYDVIVWDNGSCQEMRDWLRDEYKPTVLVESPNVGKSAAKLGLLGMVSPETIVTMTDDDMYFYPNWLAPQIKLLESVPNTSCVTGYPVRSSFRWGNENTIERVRQLGAEIERGLIMPEIWEVDFCKSIGRDYFIHVKTSREFDDMDVCAIYKGLKMYLTSHHCQHIGYAKSLRAAAVNTLMLGSLPDEKPYDKALDELGNRLATFDRLTRHMGNVMDEDLQRDIEQAEGW